MVALGGDEAADTEADAGCSPPPHAACGSALPVARTTGGGGDSAADAPAPTATPAAGLSVAGCASAEEDSSESRGQGDPPLVLRVACGLWWALLLLGVGEDVAARTTNVLLTLLLLPPLTLLTLARAVVDPTACLPRARLCEGLMAGPRYDAAAPPPPLLELLLEAPPPPPRCCVA